MQLFDEGLTLTGSNMDFVRAEFFDIDDFCHAVKTWDAEIYPLSSSNSGEIVNSTVQSGAIDCHFSSFYFNGPVKMHCASPRALTTFNVMETSRKPYWCRGHDLNSEMVWVFPADGEMESITATDFTVYTLSVTEQRIAEVCNAYEIDLPPPSDRPEAFPAAYKSLDFIRSRLRKLATLSPEIFAESVADILPLLVSNWLKSDMHAKRKRPSLRARDLAVRKSLALIEEIDLDLLTPGYLLEECCVSKRTLEYAFRERFNVTPAAFIKRMRLAAARAVLRQADPRWPGVADIASQFGFWHFAQFATDYRKAFGELPSVTLRNPY